MEPTVFIVDDDPIMGNLLQSELVDSGFEARYFKNGEEALRQIAQTDPDMRQELMVIAGLTMAGVSGATLCQRVHESSETAGIPVILLISDDGTERPAKTWRTDCLPKPFKMEELLAHMEAIRTRVHEVRSYGSQADFDGDLSLLGLRELVQIVASHPKSGRLTLTEPKAGITGSLCFTQGLLTDAQMGTLRGVEAVCALSEATQGTFAFRTEETDDPSSLSGITRASDLMAQADRVLDVSQRFFRALEDPHVLPEIRTSHIPEEIRDQEGEAALQEVLSMIQAGQTVHEIAESERMSRARAGALMSALSEAGVIDIPDMRGAGNGEREAASEGRAASGEGPLTVDLSRFATAAPELTDALGEIERGAHSGVLEISEPRSAIYAREGRIIHAFHGSSMGKKALFRIFSDKVRGLDFKPCPPAVRGTVTEPLHLLLKEGCQEAETLSRLRPETFERRLRLNPSAEEEIASYQDRPGLFHVLSLVQRFVRVRTIMDASQMTDLQTYKHLLYLVQKGLVRVDPENGPRVRVITDSASDLPADIIRKLDIRMVPLTVSLGDQTWRDRIDLTPEAFYQALRTVPPRISFPREELFLQLFRDIRTHSEEDILGIFSSGRMCESAAHAVTAGQRLSPKGNARAEIIDSGLISLGTGLAVTAAAEWVRKGESLEGVCEKVRQQIAETRLLFVADSASHLHQRGLMGWAKAFCGNLRGLKPILVMQDGVICPVDQIRGTDHALELAVQLMKQSLSHPHVAIRAGIMHADAAATAERLKSLIQSRLNCRGIILSPLGPVPGNVCGPGTVAAAYFEWMRG